MPAHPSAPGRAPRPEAAAEPDVTVRSRPRQLRWWCLGIGLGVFVAFTIVAALLPHSSDGVAFGRPDQIAVFLVGLLLALALILPTRPRVVADRGGVRVRGAFGGYRDVPWTLVRAVEFRPGWRWARLVLPADETISLYAVMRMDGTRSVEAMHGLRALSERSGAAGTGGELRR